MVDVVVAEPGAHELLEQIRLLVRAFRGPEAGERPMPVAIADLLEARGRTLERLVPARLPEMRPRVGRIDLLVHLLRHALLADQRLFQALRVVDIVEPKPALHAQAVLVRGSIAAGDVEQLIVADAIGELTADAAIRTDAVDGAVLIADAFVLLVDDARGHQRAGRASLHAFAACHARRTAHRVVEVEHDLFREPAARHADHVVRLHLAAGADA